MAELLYRLGKFSARRAWLVIISWLAVLAVAGGAFLIGFSSLASNFDIPGTASGEVTDALAEELPDYAGASGTILFSTSDGSELTAEQQAEISALVDGAGSLPDVATVIDPFATEEQRAEQSQQLADAEQQLADGQTQLDAGREQLEAGQAQLDAGQAQLAAAQLQIDDARAQLEAAGMPTAQLDAQQAEFDAQQAQLDAQAEQTTAGLAELDIKQAELDEGAATAEMGTELLSMAESIRMVSEDGSTAVVNVSFSVPMLELDEASKTAAIDYFTGTPIEGVDVSYSTTIGQSVPSIFGVGEAVGLVMAAIVLIVMLGSLLAASFPLITALVGVGIGVLASLSFSGIVSMTSVTPVLGVMLGLAVGIDYSLFIINRHRKQLLAGAELRESIGLANGTAGNAVVFAGATVIVALLALNVTGVPFLALMGTVGAVCVLVAVLLAVTMTPALLGLAGERLIGRRARARLADGAKSEKPVKAMSTWRAVVTAVLSVALLLVVAIPALSMRVGLPDGSSEPEGSPTYNGFTISAEQFGAGSNATLLVTAELPEGLSGDTEVLEAQLAVARELYGLDNVTAVAPIAVSDDNSLAAFQVIPAEGPNAESTDALVREMRALPPVNGDITLGVAGQAAINIDISESLLDVLPTYLLLVVGLSLLIMILVFRSILVPIIATGGFVLSLLATYGATVAVFQWGWFADVIGLHNTGPILSFLPVILIGILFGLAMDYQLFLASGMREAYVHGAHARDAVAQGFRAGRSVVTAAALIMVSVFGGFIFSESTMIRSIGFGLAFGVLIDAFVVRMLLMPALMHLLGKSAWWIPRWLDRIMPNVDVEGAALERRHHSVG